MSSHVERMVIEHLADDEAAARELVRAYREALYAAVYQLHTQQVEITRLRRTVAHLRARLRLRPAA